MPAPWRNVLRRASWCSIIDPFCVARRCRRLRQPIHGARHHQRRAGVGVVDDDAVDAEHVAHEPGRHDAPRLSLGDDLPVAHGDQMVGVPARVVQIVQNEHDGASVGRVELDEQVALTVGGMASSHAALAVATRHLLLEARLGVTRGHGSA